MKTKKQKNFSSFDAHEAFKALHLTELQKWSIHVQPLQPTPFFQERLRRLEHFDLTISEKAKELLIDAICEETLEYHPRLKIWKAAPLQSDEFTGTVDYLVAPKRAYLETPFVCVVEAKKDDFDQGLAQCLVEMSACRWNNAQNDRQIDVFGVVTNGEVWKFYTLTVNGDAYETLPYSLNDPPAILGMLHAIFLRCEQNAFSE